MHRGLLYSGLLAVLAGCTGQEPTTAQEFTMAGRWRHSADLRDSLTGDSHIHEGRFTLQGSGAAFSGSGRQWGSCATAPGVSYKGPLADTLPYPVVEGVQVGQSISFKTNICEYQGTFERGNPNRITGTGRCSYQFNGVNYTFAGLWQADRLP